MKIDAEDGKVVEFIKEYSPQETQPR
jgi:hypothetical protein